MKWDSYRKKFTAYAIKNRYNKEYIDACLSYAFPLFEKGLPIIFDQYHLATLVGYNYDYLLKASNSPECFYRHYQIPKRAGGSRDINEPLPSLKEIQRWILDNILYKCECSRYAKAFIPKKSIKDNARFHKNQKMVLTVDVKDFFGSIKYKRVYSYFLRLGYQKSVATLLALLCTLDNSLPQGAPTSPALSNLVSLRLDRRIAGYCSKKKIRYTRYADDFTFSGDFDSGEVINFASMVLADEGLVINEEKTRLMLQHQRQEVTGIIVNDKLQAPREVRRELRASAYYINKFGLDSHVEYIDNNKAINPAS